MQIQRGETTTSSKTAENEREKALKHTTTCLNEIVKLELLKSTHIIVNNMMHIQIFLNCIFACIPLVLLGMLNKRTIDSGSYFRFRC